MKIFKTIFITFIFLTSTVKADLNQNLIKELEQGGKLIFIRHAYAPGSGDPKNFNLNDCSTQRNLSDEGRIQSKKIGNFFEINNISIDKIYDDEFSLDYSLSNGSGCITEISGVVKLLSTDYENLEDNDIDQILLNINTNGMKFDVDIDAERLFALDDPSTTQLNYFIDVEVYSGNTLLGELELQEDENEEYYVNMVFVDGTVVNTEYLDGIGIQADDFIETIEGIIARYTDRLDD